jgi:hypothetical protein
MRWDTKPDNRIRRTSPHPAPTRFEELLADVLNGARTWQHFVVTTDKHDVVGVLHSLLAQWETGPARWENVTIPAYIEAMAAWLEGYEHVYTNTGRPVPTDGWTVFAAALQAAAIYE